MNLAAIIHFLVLLMSLSALPFVNAAKLEYTPEEEATWTKNLTAYMQAEAGRFKNASLPQFNLIIVRMFDGGSFVAVPCTA